MIKYPWVAAVLVAVAMITPGFATATHQTTYYTELPTGDRVDGTFGRTSEDDGAIANTPGSALHGLSNRVHYAGETIGQGGLFLDSRIASRVSAQNAATYYVYGEGATAPYTGRDDVIFPGYHGVATWYGWWSDIDNDGIISDVHDSAQSVEDEFLWRGRATEEEIPMPYFVYPRTKNRVTAMNNIGIFGLSEPMHSEAGMQDFTDDQDQQIWYAHGNTHGSDWSVAGPYDSLLVSFTFVTAADFTPKSGTPLRLDPSEARGLIDVDNYHALSPDVELLYFGTMQGLKPTVDAVRGVINTGYDSGPLAAIDTLNDVMREPMRPIHRTLQPPLPKEPNHALDDFNGNAVFGHVGDVAGSYNTYDGYQSGEYRVFLDAQGAMRVSYSNVNNMFFYDPFIVSPDDDPHKRQTGVVFGIKALMAAWQDKNMDGYYGVVCDPEDPAQWDSERGTCTNIPQPTDSISTGGESGAGLCSVTYKPPAQVLPIGGNWPGAIRVRNQGDVAYAATHAVPPESVTVHIDDQPIELEWWPCTSPGTNAAYGSDVIIFPAGNPTIPIMTIVTFASGVWTDRDGIDHPSETVTDVDVYLPYL